MLSRTITIFIALTLVVTDLVACGGSAGPGEPRLTTKEAEAVNGTATALEGTHWTLVSLNGEDLIEGTHITLHFFDGFVRGFAGCNAYRPLIIGSDGDKYKYAATRDDPSTMDGRESGSLTVPNFIITDKDCPSPEGVMQQERTYVEALRNAAVYRIIEDRLEIDSATGETSLVFVQIYFHKNPPR